MRLISRFLKKLAPFFFGCLGLIVCQASSQQVGPVLKIGDPAPEIRLAKSFVGSPDIDLKSDRPHEVTVLEFWATWCAPCIAVIPHLNELAESFKNKGVTFISISQEEEEVVRSFLRSHPISATIGLDKDSSTFQAFNVQSIPTTIIVDKNHRIAAVTHPNLVNNGILERVLRGEQAGLPVLDSRFSAFPLQAGQESGSYQAFLVKKSAGGFSVENLQLKEGEVRVIRVGGKSDNLDLVLPISPGQSGNLIQAADEFMMVVRCISREWRLQIRRPNGTTRDLPPVKQTSLNSYTIRVNVTGGDKTRRAFLIRRGESVVPDENAPVQDLFEGQVPLQPGDFAITTDTRVERTDPSVQGQVELRIRNGWLVAQGRVGNGLEVPFVLDTGSEYTQLDKSMLPGNVVIEPTKMKEYSDRGVRELSSSARGAGGEIQSFLGRAMIPKLTFGAFTISDVRAGVFSDLTLEANSPSGVVGQDILQRADVINFKYPRKDGETTRLLLGTEARLNGSGVIRLPFSQIGELIFVRGQINGVGGYFVLDTGARESFLSQQFADTAGVKTTPDSTKKVWGLDNRPIVVRPGTAESVALGNAKFPAVRFQIGNIPVLAQYGADQLVGLLGNSFLRQFTEVEIDYRTREVRLRDDYHQPQR